MRVYKLRAFANGKRSDTVELPDQRHSSACCMSYHLDCIDITVEESDVHVFKMYRPVHRAGILCLCILGSTIRQSLIADHGCELHVLRSEK